MLTITPIQNNKYSGIKINPKTKPVFSQKTDSFERTMPSFKGKNVDLHLPVKK